VAFKIIMTRRLSENTASYVPRRKEKKFLRNVGNHRQGDIRAQNICRDLLILLRLEVLTAMTTNSVIFGQKFPDFRRNILPPSSGSKHEASNKTNKQKATSRVTKVEAQTPQDFMAIHPK
jgi:hypothetical protein